MKKNVLLLVFSFLISLVILEFILRLWPQMLISIPNTEATWRYLWLVNREKYTSEGLLIRSDKFDPDLGWTLVENLYIHDSRGKLITSNSKGIRGQKEYDVEKNDKVRILTIGDSFTFGECVSDDETFSAYLDESDEAIEVINMGVHGYGTDQQLIKLNKEGLQYKPDVIILGFFNGDLHRNLLSFREYAKPRFVIRDDRLILYKDHIKPPEVLRKELNLYVEIFYKLLVSEFKQRLFPEDLKSEEYQLSKRLLGQFVESGRSSQAEIVFVFLPDIKEVLEGQVKPHTLYNEICGEYSLLCVDPTERIAKLLERVDDPFEYFECHYSPEIHKLIADEIYDSLKSQIIIENQ